MGHIKSKYYASLDDEDCAQRDAIKLQQAMRGLGTDEANLIRILAFKNNSHLRRVRRHFDDKFGARGNLFQWIEDDTSGDFKSFLLSLAQEESEMIADALYKAMKGMGTDDDLLINTLATRNPVEIEKAKLAFEKKYPGDDLIKWIRDDTSGDYQKVLLALVDKKGYYCKRIYETISGAGTDDSELIRIIVSLKHHDEIKKIVSEFSDPYGYAIDLTTALEMEFSTPTLREIAVTYEQMYNQPLKNALAGDVSGKYGQLILGLMEDQASRDANYIRQACVGMGTNDEKLTELLVTRGENERAAIADQYIRTFGKSLAEEVSSETSFNYKQILLALAKPKAMVLAEALRKSMKGTGTDERAITYALSHRSKKEIREIVKAYNALYTRDLAADIRSETSGWYQKGLLFLINEACAEKRRVHIPWSRLDRVRDVDN